MVNVPPDVLVAIHDGVRPYVTSGLIEACFDEAAKSGAACAAVPSKDSLRRRLPDGSSRAVPREQFFLVQTPQTFRASIWQEAYAAAPADAVFTDDASLVEAAGHSISLVEGSYANIKITTPEDLG
jgi:2-C-methyl-D-erythritol 4-phosphate cytidylyltransferase